MITSAPIALKPVFEHIPHALITIPHWVLWRYEMPADKWTKVPLTASGTGKASSTNKATWSTFERAKDAYLNRVQNADGVGFVLTGAIRVVGVDLDHIDEEGSPHERIVSMLDQRGHLNRELRF